MHVALCWYVHKGGFFIKGVGEVSFQCPSIDGMMQVLVENLPFQNRVENAPYTLQGEPKRASDYYREMMRTFMEAGYKLKRYGATFLLTHDHLGVGYEIPDTFRRQQIYLNESLARHVALEINQPFLSAATQASHYLRHHDYPGFPIFVYNNPIRWLTA